MQEEIFGPILPILTYDTKEDIEKIIWNLEKPLSLYIFSKNISFIEETNELPQPKGKRYQNNLSCDFVSVDIIDASLGLERISL